MSMEVDGTVCPLKYNNIYISQILVKCFLRNHLKILYLSLHAPLFQSHAAIVKRYNAFCVKRTANSDTEQNNNSK